MKIYIFSSIYIVLYWPKEMTFPTVIYWSVNYKIKLYLFDFYTVPCGERKCAGRMGTREVDQFIAIGEDLGQVLEPGASGQPIATRISLEDAVQPAALPSLRHFYWSRDRVISGDLLVMTALPLWRRRAGAKCREDRDPYAWESRLCTWTSHNCS